MWRQVTTTMHLRTFLKTCAALSASTTPNTRAIWLTTLFCTEVRFMRNGTRHIVYLTRNSWEHHVCVVKSLAYREKQGNMGVSCYLSLDCLPSNHHAGVKTQGSHRPIKAFNIFIGLISLSDIFFLNDWQTIICSPDNTDIHLSHMYSRHPWKLSKQVITEERYSSVLVFYRCCISGISVSSYGVSNLLFKHKYKPINHNIMTTYRRSK